jgi:hypothetical protein
VDIHPKDLKYKEGDYYIGVMPYRKGLNTFSTKVSITEAGKYLIIRFIRIIERILEIESGQNVEV